MNCYICQCNVQIPVQITCFPCFKVNKIHCNTYIRCCYECVVRFLQLNSSVVERNENLKCLLCDCKVNLKYIDFTNAFQYDYLLQQQNQEKEKCPFCFSFFDNIYQHIEQCESNYFQCSCGYVSIHQLKNYHYLHCSFFVECDYCNEYVDKNSFLDHLRVNHDKTMCLDCNKIISFSDENIHIQYLCQYRYIHCKFCKQSVQFCQLNDHLELHKEEIMKMIEYSKTIMNKLYKKYREIHSEQSVYFQRLFLTNS